MSDVKRYEIERYNPDTVMYPTCDGEWELHADAQAARDADAAEIARLREALAKAERERDYAQASMRHMSATDTLRRDDERALRAALSLPADATIEAMVERARRLKLVNDCLCDLIEDSEGVYGLHKNGDPAPWDELRPGGRFEGWVATLADLEGGTHER